MIALGVGSCAAGDEKEKPAVADEQIKQLIRDLGSDSFDAREKASKKLAEMGRAALPLLEQAAVTADDAEIRIRAGRAVEAIKGSERYLRESLTDKDAKVRREAAERLAILGPAAKGALPELVKRLADETDEQARDAVIGAILGIDSKHESVAKLVPAKASAEGKYKTLLRRIKVPQDRQQYQDYHDYGRFEGSSWAGYNDLPAGYWVYVYPHWFIWGEQAK
jgi:HEAT repeat protein